MNPMEIIEFIAKEIKRIDVLISEEFENISRSYAKRLIEEGNVLVNEVSVKSNYKTKEGDVISVTEEEPSPIEAEPEDIPINVVYEDEDVLVVNKPRGMVVHPAVGNEHGTLVNAALFHCKNSLSGINGKFRPGSASAQTEH